MITLTLAPPRLVWNKGSRPSCTLHFPCPARAPGHTPSQHYHCLPGRGPSACPPATLRAAVPATPPFPGARASQRRLVGRARRSLGARVPRLHSESIAGPLLAGSRAEKGAPDQDAHVRRTSRRAAWLPGCTPRSARPPQPRPSLLSTLVPPPLTTSLHFAPPRRHGHLPWAASAQRVPVPCWAPHRAVSAAHVRQR